MIRKLYAVIEKNIRQLVHSKSSALIILISPIILMALAGFALSSSGLSGVKVGVYAPEGSEIRNTLDAKMVAKGFGVMYFDTLEQCKQGVKNEITHICVEIADKNDNSLARIDARLTKKVNFYVDYSKVRLVWAIVNAIRNIVTQESNAITGEMTSKVTKNIDMAITQIEKNKATMDKLIAKAESANHQIGNSEDYINSIDSGLVSVSSSLNSASSMMNDAANGANQITQYVNNFCNDLNSMMGNIPMPYNETLKENCVNLQNSIAGSVSAITSANSNLARTNAQIINSINDLRTKDNSAKSSLKEIRNLLDANVNELKKLKSDILKATDDISWVKDIKAADIMNPIPVEILPISGEVTEVGSVSSAMTYLDYLLPALLILVVMFVSILISSTIVIKERKTSAYFRNIIAPTNSVMFVLGVYLIGTILVMLQAALLVGVAVFFFGVSFTSPFPILLIVFLTISIFITLGIIIGYAFNSEETTMMGAISLALIFLLFSTLIIPLETMPWFMRAVAQFSPFIISEVALRKTMIFNIPLSGCVWEIVKLAVTLGIVITAAILLERVKKKKEI